MGIFDRLFGKRKEEPKPQPPPPAPPAAPPPPPVSPPPQRTTPSSPFDQPSTTGRIAERMEQRRDPEPPRVTPPPPLPVVEPPPPVVVVEPEPVRPVIREPEPIQVAPPVYVAPPSLADVPPASPTLPLEAPKDLFAEFGDLTEEERQLLLELQREESESANREPSFPPEPAPITVTMPAMTPPEPEPEPEPEIEAPVGFTSNLDRALGALLDSQSDLEALTVTEEAPVESSVALGSAGMLVAPEAGIGQSFLDDELGDFDDAFDALVVGEEQALEDGEHVGVEYDQSEIKELFANIAANYIRPVKTFVFELRTGSARKEWVEICQPAMLTLGKSANGMGLLDVSEAIARFDSLLIEARASFETTVSGDLRDRILKHYDELTEMLPQTFTLGEEGAQSEGMIINSLLKQIPDVGKVTIDRLYRAGLTTLESYFMGTKEDIAVASGLPIWLAERVCDKFKQYQQDLETKPVDAGNSAQRTKLEKLIQDLQEYHDSYEQATAAEWTNPAAAEDRRFFRQARQDTQLQINVVLAELQAVDLVREIQRLSFEKRIQRLQEFLATLANEAAG
ncbi:MAG: hypothetical protein K1Y36_13305 [Blastocatellia bacterium]|nr:hypothetical protein [Blastocatellia bacterium]